LTGPDLKKGKVKRKGLPLWDLNFDGGKGGLKTLEILFQALGGTGLVRVRWAGT